MTKSVITLALILCAAASVQAANSRRLFQTLTCLAGTETDGNNRPNTLPSCNTGDYLCATGECNGGCPAQCCKVGGTDCFTMNVDEDDSNTSGKGYPITFDIGGTPVPLSSIYQLYLKGGNGYCYIAQPGSAVYTPSDGTSKVLSHADYCYSPCKCTAVTFSDTSDKTLCPGATLPAKSTYTAKDNCGNNLPVTVSDSPNVDSNGCGTITRTISATCSGNPVTKTQTFTYTDGDVSFDTCSTAHSTCLSSIALDDPVAVYIKDQCKFSFTRTAKNACGKQYTDVKYCSPF